MRSLPAKAAPNTQGQSDTRQKSATHADALMATAAASNPSYFYSNHDGSLLALLMEMSASLEPTLLKSQELPQPPVISQSGLRQQIV
jgi:hypothetical protein